MEVYYQKETFISQDKWGLAFQRVFSSIFLQKCPACAQAPVFKNYFELKESCPNCKVTFERDKGSSILSMALSYFLVILVSLALSWPILANFGFFDGITFVFVGIVLILIFAFHRPTKGAYLWMLWCFGFIYPDAKLTNEIEES